MKKGIDDLRKIQPGNFKPQPYYDRKADAIYFHFSEEESRMERVDSLLTLFISEETGQITGFSIKGFGGIIKLLISELVEEFKETPLKDVFSSIKIVVSMMFGRKLPDPEKLAESKDVVKKKTEKLIKLEEEKTRSKKYLELLKIPSLNEPLPDDALALTF